jgi:hypothetical protein
MAARLIATKHGTKKEILQNKLRQRERPLVRKMHNFEGVEFVEIN